MVPEVTSLSQEHRRLWRVKPALSIVYEDMFRATLSGSGYAPPKPYFSALPVPQ